MKPLLGSLWTLYEFIICTHALGKIILEVSVCVLSYHHIFWHTSAAGIHFIQCLTCYGASTQTYLRICPPSFKGRPVIHTHEITDNTLLANYPPGFFPIDVFGVLMCSTKHGDHICEAYSMIDFTSVVGLYRA